MGPKRQLFYLQVVCSHRGLLHVCRKLRDDFWEHYGTSTPSGCQYVFAKSGNFYLGAIEDAYGFEIARHPERKLHFGGDWLRENDKLVLRVKGGLNTEGY